MPAAARHSERRPSAATTSGARNLTPLLSVTVTLSSPGATLLASSSITRSEGKRSGALLERRDQMAVLDIVAEGVEIDFVGREFHFRRAPQPAGVVDDAHDPQRRRLRRAERPDAERLQRGDRAGEAARWCGCRGGRGRFPTSTVARPAPASAIAAVSPAGPPPTTITEG